MARRGLDTRPFWVDKKVSRRLLFTLPLERSGNEVEPQGSHREDQVPRNGAGWLTAKSGNPKR